MYTSICWYLRVLPVLHRPEVVDIGVNTIQKKHAICLKDYRIRSFLSIRHAYGDLGKHLGIDSSTDLDYMYTQVKIIKTCLLKIVKYFLTHNLSTCLGCPKEPFHWDGSFEYPQHRFCSRNTQKIFFCKTLFCHATKISTITK